MCSNAVAFLCPCVELLQCVVALTSAGRRIPELNCRIAGTCLQALAFTCSCVELLYQWRASQPSNAIAGTGLWVKGSEISCAFKDLFALAGASGSIDELGWEANQFILAVTNAGFSIPNLNGGADISL